MQHRIAITFALAILLSACGESTPPEPETPTSQSQASNGSEAGSMDAEPTSTAPTGTAGEPSVEPPSQSDGSSGQQAGNVELLVALGLVRGHLHAANALYDAGEARLAARQLEQPRMALDGELAQMLEARGMPTFEEEITTFFEAVEGGADAGEVTEAWRTADESIESVGRDIDSTPKQELMSVAGLLDHIADRYRTGIVDRVVENEHDYQAAWGFYQVALQRVGQLNTTSEVPRESISEAAIVLANLEDLWPSLEPVEEVFGKVERVEVAAERIRGMANELG
ncbi:MAG: hypothetical protein ACNS61_06540 [Candidatus Wenzhouxiangella sp. M2_3B_020]